MANATNSDKTGVSCYDGAGTFNGRTITAGTGISISNGNGVSGNPTVSADTDVATTYTADSGSATPAANNLNVLGGSGIDTSGSGSTLTITAAAAVPLTFTCDTGSATPAANNLNVVGSGGTSTSGSGSTITVTSSGGGGGGVVQQVQTSTASYSTITTYIPFDDTIPQITEGTQIFSLAITPSDASNILVFDISFMFGANDSGVRGNVALFQGATTNAIYATGKYFLDPDDFDNFTARYYKTAGTTSSTTFTVRVGSQTGSGKSLYINGAGSLVGAASRKFGGVSLATFTITEYEP